MTAKIISQVTWNGSEYPASRARIAHVFSLEFMGPSEVSDQTLDLRPSAQASGPFRRAATAEESLPRVYGLTFLRLVWVGSVESVNAGFG